MSAAAALAGGRDCRRFLAAKRFRVVALAGAALATGAPSLAADTWIGGGANDNWSLAGNWMSGVAPAAGAAQDLTFGGNARLTPAQNIANPYVLNRLQFANGAGAFTLGGSQVSFGGNNPRITQLGANNQTITMPLAIPGALTTDGAGTGRVDINSVISGAGGFTKTGGYVARFGGGPGANTYTGVTNVTEGTLELNKAAGVTAIAGNLTIGNGAGVDTVRNLNSNQIADMSNVTISGGGGVWNLNGRNETVATIRGGGEIQFGANTANLFSGGAGRATPFSGALIGAGHFHKVGNDELHLSGNSPQFTGRLSVSGGTLRLNGTLGTANARMTQVIVENNSILTGAGRYWSRFRTTVGPGSKIKPGNSPAILTIDGDTDEDGGVSFEPDSFLSIEMDGPAAGAGAGFHSQLAVNGRVGIDNALLEVRLDSAPVFGNDYVILANDESDPVSGIFAGLPEGATFDADYGGASYPFAISYLGGTGNDVVLTSLVPEPASLGLLAIGAAFGLVRRRR